MKKAVPFISNSEDNLHCVPAVFRMVYEYYLGKKYNWKKIDEIMKTEQGKGTWTFPGITALANKGLKITHIEPLDYEKLYENGPEYLKDIFGKETAEYYVKRSNISSVIKYIPEYLESVKQINRASSLDEAIEYLKKDYIVTIEINSRILSNKKGVSLHYVLLHGFENDKIILHDPGLPPIRNQIISKEKLNKAFDYPGANKTITAFKK